MKKISQSEIPFIVQELQSNYCPIPSKMPKAKSKEKRNNKVKNESKFFQQSKIKVIFIQSSFFYLIF